MNLLLVPIPLETDKTLPLYASENCQTLLNAYQSYYPKIGFHLPWIGYFMMKDGEVVGSCGFTGKPQNQTVEIAYWTFSEFEGQGFASFACKSLVEMAQKQDSSLTIIAKTAPEHNASTHILTKNGFIYSQIVQDDEIGNAWLWIYQP